MKTSTSIENNASLFAIEDEAIFTPVNDNPSFGYIAGSDTKCYEESTNRSGVRGIRRSFSFRKSTQPNPAGGADREISYGDRLFARLVMHGKTVVEFMVNSINDLSELWGELRRKCRGVSGLARLYLRNASRGWSMVRPLMIYPDGYRRKSAPETSPQGKRNAVATYTVITPKNNVFDDIARAFCGEATQLSFRWDM
ncbi:MAG: hypothetical protein K2M93_00740 [Muribaculaceae bacterium]|nr:hypothetical protein [Muribaculaceae bacterium]